jgi:hypothetical protein
MAFCCVSALAGTSPVLTVCEAVQNLRTYRGTNVVVVGLAGWTIEGGFLTQRCPTRQDPSATGLIALKYDGVGSLPPPGFEAYHDSLIIKLREARQSTAINGSSEHAISASARWLAVYGRLDGPQIFRPPRKHGDRMHPGNGFGANGSVPAQLISSPLAEYDFGGKSP